MTYQFACRMCGTLVFVSLLTTTLHAQQPANVAESQLPEITDKPRMIDPAALMSPKLAATATHDFSDSSFREVVAWLRDKQGLVVLVDRNVLSEIGISPAEPISDLLKDDPVYLLLNRLRSLGLAWYFEDEILYITSSKLAEEHATTLPYNVGDLLDAGYRLETIETVISGTIAPESWENLGGDGVLNSLGDVLFVRQNEQLQLEVKALLEALRNHARQTFINDPPKHLELRDGLDELVSVDFADTPLESAVRQLAEIAQIDIRLDIPALRDIRVREREPVTLKLANRKLATVLQALSMDLDLTWILRDGVLWITSSDQAESSLKTAVYDVRDLCRDAEESQALIEAITSQTEPQSWDEFGGPGAIEPAKPGTLVITHQERIHTEVLGLLETYRTSLRSSKLRKREEVDPDEVITVYYRLYANVAQDLANLLPRIVQPESWSGDERPEAPGKIMVVSSVPDLSKVAGVSAIDSETKQPVPKIVIERAVLIVRQTRATHDEIEEIIRRVESGDSHSRSRSGGLGGGGGGFGGGFFSVSTDNVSQ